MQWTSLALCLIAYVSFYFTRERRFDLGEGVRAPARSLLCLWRNHTANACAADDKLKLIESLCTRSSNASCVRQKKSQALSQGPRAARIYFVCASCCCCAPSFSMQTTFAGIMLLKARAQDNNQRFQVMLFIFIILSLLLDEMKGADRCCCRRRRQRHRTAFIVICPTLLTEI